MRILGIGPDVPESTIEWGLGLHDGVVQKWLPWNANSPTESAAAIIAEVKNFRPDFAVVWPKLEPLTCGIADKLEDIGVPTVGPKAFGAKLEGSKVFTYEFARQNGIPVPDFQVFSGAEGSKQELVKRARSGEPLPVLKPDGVIGMSGVLLPTTLEEALAGADHLVRHYGPKHLHQQRVYGREFSLIILTDGEGFKLLPITHIYKRPPGYGAFSPVPGLGLEIINRVLKEVIEPTLAGMRKLGQPYRGFLYTDMILTDDNRLYLFEHNCRLAYPETEVILARLVSNFAELLGAAAFGTLDQTSLLVSERAAVCVVLLGQGYPGPIEPGAIVTGIEKARESGCLVFLNGVSAAPNPKILGNTSRPILVVGLGESIEEARVQAYEGADCIKFDGKWFKRDIALDL